MLDNKNQNKRLINASVSLFDTGGYFLYLGQRYVRNECQRTARPHQPDSRGKTPVRASSGRIPLSSSRQTTSGKSNLDFWEEKFKRNIERDEHNSRELLERGWEVLTVWECEIERNLGAVVDYLSTHFAQLLKAKTDWLTERASSGSIWAG